MNGKGVTLSEGLFARIMNDLRGIFRKKGKKDAVQQKPPQVKTSPPKPPKAMEIAQSAKPSQRPVSEAKEIPNKTFNQPGNKITEKSSLELLLGEMKGTGEKGSGLKNSAGKAKKVAVNPRIKKKIYPAKKIRKKFSQKKIKPKRTKKIKSVGEKKSSAVAVGATTKTGPKKTAKETKPEKESKPGMRPINNAGQMEGGETKPTAGTGQSQGDVMKEFYSQPNQTGSSPPDIEMEIATTRELMKRLETYYLKRKITDSEFRTKMLEYKEKLFLLNMKKNDLEKKGISKPAGQQPPPNIIEHPNASSSISVSTILREKAKGNIDEGKLKGIEEKLETLMKRYNIPKEEIESKVEGLETAKIIDSFNKLISLLELEKKAEQELNKVYRIQTVTGFKESAKKVDEIKGIATELKKHRIVTDFDRVLNLVDEESRISVGSAAELLEIPKKRVEECAEILEKDKLVELSYPPIGDAFIQVIDYKGRKKLLDKKKKEKTSAAAKLKSIADAGEKNEIRAESSKNEGSNTDALSKLNAIAKEKMGEKQKGDGDG